MIMMHLGYKETGKPTPPRVVTIAIIHQYTNDLERRLIRGTVNDEEMRRDGWRVKQSESGVYDSGTDPIFRRDLLKY